MITSIVTEPGYTVIENAPLTARNTFRVPARTELLIDVHDANTLPDLFKLGALKTGPVLVLGEGSNVLLTRDWPGVVLSLAARGIRVLQDRGDSALVRVEAGENWNDFVHWSIGQGFAGLENLVAIPGTVGAAPMQNIGAYGVEVGEFIESVEAYDLQRRHHSAIRNTACEFGYRDSIFKRNPDRWLITAVTLRLPREWKPRTEYSGIQEELQRTGLTRPASIHVADAVVALRTRKLPDPKVIGNAGSFFKNPLVPNAQAEPLRTEYPQLPSWPAPDGLAKLSAAWLIEASGFKGVREGDAGISNRHALVLVNHGHASGGQLWAFAQRVREGVHARFGIMLEPEPRIIVATA